MHLYAMSNHGQDEAWIDARAVTVVEKTVKGGLEYIPYLWVGVRAVSGGDGWFNDDVCTDELPGNMFCLGLGTDGYAYKIMLVTERLETLNLRLMLGTYGSRSLTRIRSRTRSTPAAGTTPMAASPRQITRCGIQISSTSGHSTTSSMRMRSPCINTCRTTGYPTRTDSSTVPAGPFAGDRKNQREPRC